MRLRVAVALVLVAALAGCGARPFVDFEPEIIPGGARPDVRFTATLATQGGRLVITYKLVNAGSVAVVAYNGMQGAGLPPGSSRVGDVYVTARKDGTVEIGKRAYEVPGGVEPAGAEVLRGTVLPPGADLTEKVPVPLPLTGRRPYLADVKLPDPVGAVTFCLGVARIDALEAPVPQPSAGEADEKNQDTRPLFNHPSPQHLFCSDPRPL